MNPYPPCAICEAETGLAENESCKHTCRGCEGMRRHRLEAKVPKESAVTSSNGSLHPLLATAVTLYLFLGGCFLGEWASRRFVGPPSGLAIRATCRQRGGVATISAPDTRNQVFVVCRDGYGEWR